jgi:predicted AAA+ superfamily ATPase
MALIYKIGGLMVIERKRYLDRLAARIDNQMIKVVTGVRRSGKSFLLFNLFYRYLIQNGVPEDHIIMLSLDDIDNEEYRKPKNLYAFLKERIRDSSEHYFIFIDEIQLAISKEELKQKDTNVELYGVLNGLLRRENVDVYVTGSNSKLLATDVMTEFRGRGDEVRVLPLSFSEYFPVAGQSKEDSWRDYLFYGGMPHIFSLSNAEQKVQYLNSLNREIYLRDIEERYDVKNLTGMEELMKVIASSVGSLTNPQKISDTFKSSGMKGVSSPTIAAYLTYLQDAGLIFKVERYDVKGRKYISTPVKYYYADTGLRNALLGFRQFEETHLMENVIYNELLYRGYSVDVGVVPVRSTGSNGSRMKRKLEIDFIANKGSKRYYLQSAFAIPNQEKINQEQESLVNVSDSFKKIIVTGTNSPLWRNEQGITFISIYDFLLNENSLEM